MSRRLAVLVVLGCAAAAQERAVTPCNETACSDSRCQLNHGKCEFKTKIGRMCANVPLNRFCPDYCDTVHLSGGDEYCQAKSDPWCSVLPRELCGEPYRCIWDANECKKHPWTPCNEPGCTDSRCQLNNGKCEFKTKIDRECAKALNPSTIFCPIFCTYVPPGSEGNYLYCKGNPSVCYTLPEHLCNADAGAEQCEYWAGSCFPKNSLQFRDTGHSHRDRSPTAAASTILLWVSVPAVCFVIGMFLLRYVKQRTTRQVVISQPVVMIPVVTQGNYSNLGHDQAVPACGTSVNAYLEDAPPTSGYPVQAVATPVEDAPQDPSPPAY